MLSSKMTNPNLIQCGTIVEDVICSAPLIANLGDLVSILQMLSVLTLGTLTMTKAASKLGDANGKIDKGRQ